MTQNTPPSTDLRHDFGITFSLLARRWRQKLHQRLAEAGVATATWPPLVHLSRQGGGLNQKELAALVGVDSSSLVRVLDQLERDALLERRRGAEDGRTRLLYLTAKGEAYVAELMRLIHEIEDDLTATLSQSELAQAMQIFAKIDAQLRAEEP